jgi:hypothetical protein
MKKDVRALSLPRRMIVLAGAGVVLAVGMLAVLLLHRTPSAAPVIPAPLPTVVHHHATAHARVAQPSHHRHQARAVSQAAKAVHLDQGLPVALRVALASHDVVVAVVAAPDDSVDATTIVAAADGARQAHAGFALLNVRDRATADAVAALVPSAGEPTILVVRRPGTISGEFSGYEDPTTVAQAVLDLR